MCLAATVHSCLQMCAISTKVVLAFSTDEIGMLMYFFFLHVCCLHIGKSQLGKVHCFLFFVFLLSLLYFGMMGILLEMVAMAKVVTKEELTQAISSWCAAVVWLLNLHSKIFFTFLLSSWEWSAGLLPWGVQAENGHDRYGERTLCVTPDDWLPRMMRGRVMWTGLRRSQVKPDAARQFILLLPFTTDWPPPLDLSSDTALIGSRSDNGQKINPINNEDSIIRPPCGFQIYRTTFWEQSESFLS